MYTHMYVQVTSFMTTTERFKSSNTQITSIHPFTVTTTAMQMINTVGDGRMTMSGSVMSVVPQDVATGPTIRTNPFLTSDEQVMIEDEQRMQVILICLFI